MPKLTKTKKLRTRFVRQLDDPTLLAALDYLRTEIVITADDLMDEAQRRGLNPPDLDLEGVNPAWKPVA